MRLQCENKGCSPNENLQPVSVDRKEETVTFKCLSCDGETTEHVDGLKDIPGLISHLMCPGCLEEGDSGRMLLLGTQQRIQGYEYIQIYDFQCMDCGELWIEERTVQAKNSQRRPRDRKIELEVNENWEEEQETLKKEATAERMAAMREAKGKKQEVVA